MSPVDQATAEQEQRHHTYVGHAIPWYVRLIWMLFWAFAIVYVLQYFVPSIQEELLTPP